MKRFAQAGLALVLIAFSSFLSLTHGEAPGGQGLEVRSSMLGLEFQIPASWEVKQESNGLVRSLILARATHQFRPGADIEPVEDLGEAVVLARKSAVGQKVNSSVEQLLEPEDFIAREAAGLEDRAEVSVSRRPIAGRDVYVVNRRAAGSPTPVRLYYFFMGDEVIRATIVNPGASDGRSSLVEQLFATLLITPLP